MTFTDGDINTRTSSDSVYANEHACTIICGAVWYQINNGCPTTVSNKLTMSFVSLNPTATHPAAVPSM